MSVYKSIKQMISAGFKLTRNDKKLSRSLLIVWGGSILFYFFNIIFPKAQSFLLDGLIDSIQQDSVNLIMIIGAALMALCIIYKSIYNYIISARRDYAMSKIQNHIQNILFSKKLSIEYGYFEIPGNLDKVKMIQEEYAPMFAYFFGGGALTSIVGSLISFICVTLIVFRVHAGVAVLLTVGNLFGFFQTFSESKWNYYQIAGNMRERRFAETYSGLLSNRAFLKEIRLLGLSDYLRNRWKEKQSAVRKRTFLFNVRFFLIDLLTYGLNYGFIVAALVWTTYLIFHGECSAGAFLLVYSSSTSILDTSGSLFSAFYFIKNASVFSAFFDEFLALPEIESSAKEADNSLQKPKNMNIDFNHVTFTYDGMNDPAISDVSFHINQGEHVAIVGANGSGKTTIVSLLNSFFIPQQGEILLGNIPIGNCVSYMRQNSSILLQEFGQYETSVRENIAIGAQTQDDLENQIVCAAQKADAWLWISSLPSGLDTPIGRYEHGGINLSGGQWQKLAIARTVIRSGASLFVMDEPNAALDPVSELEMYNSLLKNIPENQTMILISHRLGVVRYADRIIVMDHGMVVEDGTHQELMAQNGLYKKMFTLQASLYD